MAFKFNIGELAQWFGIAGNFLRGTVSEGIKKEMESSHGLDAEAIKEATLQEARRKGFIDSTQIGKIRRIETLLRRKSNRYFQNYCDILKEFSKLPKPVLKEDVTGTGAKQIIVKTFDPDWVSPGIAFFVYLAETITDEEAEEFLANVGVFQDAPYGGLRTAVPILRWLKEKGYDVGVSALAGAKVFASTNSHLVDEGVEAVNQVARTGLFFIAGLVVALLALISFFGFYL